MQLDSLGLHVFEDLLRRFERFCFSKAPLETLPPSSSPFLLLIDHSLATPWKVFQDPMMPPPLVATTSRTLLDPYLQKKQGVQGVILKETHPTFTASFSLIIVCLLGIPATDPEAILKQWAGCLAPHGKLLFLLLGEMTLYELLKNPSFTDVCPPHLLLSQRTLSWIDGFQTNVYEEWIRLQNPSFAMLRTTEKLIFKESDRLLTPIFARQGTEEQDFNRLTLHMVYGEMNKLEQNNDT